MLRKNKRKNLEPKRVMVPSKAEGAQDVAIGEGARKRRGHDSNYNDSKNDNIDQQQQKRRRLGSTGSNSGTLSPGAVSGSSSTHSSSSHSVDSRSPSPSHDSTGSAASFKVRLIIFKIPYNITF